jgi:hypothetical protein
MERLMEVPHSAARRVCGILDLDPMSAPPGAIPMIEALHSFNAASIESSLGVHPQKG